MRVWNSPSLIGEVCAFDEPSRLLNEGETWPILGWMGELADVPTFLLDQVLEELNKSTGFDLKGYRRKTLLRRLDTRLALLRSPDPESYMRLLRSDPAEPVRLIDTLVVQVSSFFREPIVFEIVAQSVLPAIIERRRSEGRKEMRVWCAGCASGEEAYSMAILIHEVLKEDAASWCVRVFGTDLSTKALNTAREAVYGRESLATTRLGIVDRYFVPRGLCFEVRPFIRSMVHFSIDDLLSKRRITPAESVFGTFDMVLCRNVLIYFSDWAQGAVFSKLAMALVEGGCLILGSSEVLPGEYAEQFATVDRRNRIFTKELSSTREPK
jgi:chemotaxis protein methyltransferase CheR